MKIRATVALASCLVALSGSPSWSSVAGVRASERVVVDPSFDVQRPEVPYNNHYVPAPDRVIGDITRLSVRHGRARVRVRVKTQELVRMPGDLPRQSYVLTSVGVRTDAAEYGAVLYIGPRTEFVFFDRAGGELSCRGLRHTFDIASDSVTFSFPRRCLGQPRWVTATALMIYKTLVNDDEFIDVAPDNPGARHFEAAYTRRAWHQAA